MVTVCLPCRKSTGVGEEGGAIGLPSLDETPRGSGPHRLAEELTGRHESPGTEHPSETFGYIYSGFRAIGLFVHSLEVYREFLLAHSGSGHRLFEWVEDIDPPPAGYEDLADSRGSLYNLPAAVPGYVFARVGFRCQTCGQSFESPAAEWVQPFEPRVLAADVLRRFKERGVDPGEMNMYEAHPFEIDFIALRQWLKTCLDHSVEIRLLPDDITRWRPGSAGFDADSTDDL